MKSIQIPLQFRQHDLSRDLKTERLRCSVCRWSWRKPPVSECPGVPRYSHAAIPAHLAHRTALRVKRLKPGGPPRGVYYRAGMSARPTRWCPLYAVAEAMPLRREGAGR